MKFIRFPVKLEFNLCARSLRRLYARHMHRAPSPVPNLEAGISYSVLVLENACGESRGIFLKKKFFLQKFLFVHFFDLLRSISIRLNLFDRARSVLVSDPSFPTPASLSGRTDSAQAVLPKILLEFFSEFFNLLRRRRLLLQRTAMNVCCSPKTRRVR